VGDGIASAFFQASLAEEDTFVLSLVVERAKQGSKVAFEFLYERYWSPIFTHIAMMIGGNHDIASDLTQETFLKAWKELPKTNEETPRKFRPWLYKIAHNLAHDYFRQSSQSRLLLGSLEQEAVESVDGMARNGSKGKQSLSVEGPEDIVCEKELVKDALGQIKPRYREALLLEVFSNGTQAEKAKQLHIREGTFSGYVHRAREELKAAYRRLEEALGTQEEKGSDYE
jgi:RNA polymerase sigma-70 factor (ECF subfamily)